MSSPKISVVTPTLRRPQEVGALLENLGRQTLLPAEVVLVDGAPPEERATEEVVRVRAPEQPFDVRYIRHGGGTAIQRNAGIEAATGDYVAFVDDDVRLEPDFFQVIIGAFTRDVQAEVGGIVGYRVNTHFSEGSVRRWRWYRRLRLLSIYEPGRYDYETGYPINANLQPPFEGVRPVDFMTTACAVWRRAVFDEGLRFDPFFRNYGILEDAHFSLRAGRRWTLLQCGNARCEELASPRGRESNALQGYKRVVNYYYVFNSIAGPLTARQKWRFWRYQAFELVRMLLSFLVRRRRSDLLDIQGRLRGCYDIARGAAFETTSTSGRG